MDPLKYQNQDNLQSERMTQRIFYKPNILKKIWIIIGIVALLLIIGTVVFLVLNKKTPLTNIQEPFNQQIGFPAGDTIVDIQRELKAVDLGNLEAEIKNTDSDIKNL